MKAYCIYIINETTVLMCVCVHTAQVAMSSSVTCCTFSGKSIEKLLLRSINIQVTLR